MNLGKKLIILRKQNKLTQETVAEELSVTRQTISNWELEQTKPDIDQIKRISKLYNISVDELIDNDIKDLLTKKINIVERLTNNSNKKLKWILIFIVSFIIIYIGWIVLSVNTYAWFVDGSLFHACTLNDETYYIEIHPYYEKIKNGYKDVTVEQGDIKEVIVSPYISIPELEKYSKVYQARNLIYNYFESSGGSCESHVTEMFKID